MEVCNCDGDSFSAWVRFGTDSKGTPFLFELFDADGTLLRLDPADLVGEGPGFFIIEQDAWLEEIARPSNHAKITKKS